MGSGKSAKPSHPPTKQEVQDRLLDLLGGATTREQVADWARQWLDADELAIDPDVRRALVRLIGADLPSTDRPYLHEDVDFRSWLDDLSRRS